VARFENPSRHKHKRYAQLHMGLLSIFKTRQKRKGAGATLYPDKIVLETIDRIKDSYEVITANVTVLNANVDNEILGKTLRHHLDQSRDNLGMNDTTESYKDYLKAAGFKTRKDHYKNALHLMIGQKDGKIILEPTINGGPTGKDRGFANTTDKPIAVDENATNKELGDMIRLSWIKCMCNYA
jgi:hypothetical protein